MNIRLVLKIGEAGCVEQRPKKLRQTPAREIEPEAIGEKEDGLLLHKIKWALAHILFPAQFSAFRNTTAAAEWLHLSDLTSSRVHAQPGIFIQLMPCKEI